MGNHFYVHNHSSFRIEPLTLYATPNRPCSHAAYRRHCHFSVTATCGCYEDSTGATPVEWHIRRTQFLQTLCKFSRNVPNASVPNRTVKGHAKERCQGKQDEAGTIVLGTPLRKPVTPLANMHVCIDVTKCSSFCYTRILTGLLWITKSATRTSKQDRILWTDTYMGLRAEQIGPTIVLFSGSRHVWTLRMTGCAHKSNKRPFSDLKVGVRCAIASLGPLLLWDHTFTPHNPTPLFNTWTITGETTGTIPKFKTTERASSTCLHLHRRNFNNDRVLWGVTRTCKQKETIPNSFFTRGE